MSNPTPELEELVRKHLTDVDQHGYVEGEDDVVLIRDLQELLATQREQLLHIIETELKPLTTIYGFTGIRILAWDDLTDLTASMRGKS